MKMGSGPSPSNPVIVSAFHRALLNQGFVVLGLAVVVLVAWNVARAAQYRRAVAGDAADPATPEGTPRPSRPAPTRVAGSPAVALSAAEPAARRLLRISFGLLWVFDGILQGQSSMPTGLIPDVVAPAASSSPGWVQHLVASVSQAWSYHPITAAAATVWIQIGIGLWLLAAPRGNWSRLAGVASVGWGLCIWAFGEAFGAVFAPGLSWLTGAPGSALIYALAGVLIALPENAWSDGRLGRWLLRALGLFLLGMAVLQAWPGRGFWQGQATASETPGSLTGSIQSMAQMQQPQLFHSVSNAFAGFDAAHGWAVNLAAVIAMAGIGAGLLAARPAINRAAVIVGTVLCLATWVLVQDLGFLGGTGTDPNTAIPFALVMIGAYLAVTRTAPAPATAAVDTRRDWRAAIGADPAYAFRAIAALAAVGVTVLGAAPMAYAAAHGQADPIVADAVDGPPQAIDIAAPNFHLVNQIGRPVSLAGLAGKTVAITFLDPVCTNDCPIIAQEFRRADGLLGSDRSKVALIAIDANPSYISPEFLAAFDNQEHLDQLPNWDYLTGSLAQLQSTWKGFGVEVIPGAGGAMVDHSDIAYVIDPSGHTRYVLSTDPGPGTNASQSSFAVTLADTIRKVLSGS